MGNVAYYEGETTIGGLFNALRDKILTAYTTGTNNWALEKQESGHMIFKMITDAGKTAYIDFRRASEDYRKGIIKIKYSDSIDGATKELTNASGETFLGLGINSGLNGMFQRTDDMFASYCLSMNNNYMALAIKGDPSFDYTAYNVGFMYFGAIVPFSDTDIDGNIALTSTVPYSTSLYGGVDAPEYYYSTDNAKPNGKYSSKGVKDISMLKTYGKLPFQQHYPALLFNSDTVDEISKTLAGGTINNFFFNASQWSGKFHASPIYVTHPYDGYRGYFENVISVNPQNLIERDVLQENVGTDQNPIYQTYRLVFLHTNNAINFLSDLKSEKYIVAIRMT